MKSVRVFGVDFSSSPGSGANDGKIYAAECELKNGDLVLIQMHRLSDEKFKDLEELIEANPTAVFGFDFPFGQSNKFLSEMGWPHAWDSYTTKCETQSWSSVEEVEESLRRSRPKSQKYCPRRTEELAKLRGAKNIGAADNKLNPPLLKMFFRGAPLLKKFDCAFPVWGSLSRARSVAFEAYPAMVQLGLIGMLEPYKGNDEKNQKRTARERLMDAAQSETALKYYGARARIPKDIASAMIDDQGADQVDALLCALQAAWATMAFDQSDISELPSEAFYEGWICDPLIAPRDVDAGTADATVTPVDILYDKLKEQEDLFVLKAYEEIKAGAKLGNFVSYQKLKQISGASNMNSVFYGLDKILAAANQCELPAISSIVVGAASVSDGEMAAKTLDGFLASAKRAGFSLTGSGRDFMRCEQHRTFEYFRRSRHSKHGT